MATIEAKHRAASAQYSDERAGPDHEAGASSRRMSRRRFLRRAIGGVVAAPVVAGGYAWGIEPVWETINRLPMPIRGLPKGLAGLTIVQISDLHIGSSVPMSHLEDVVCKVNGLRPGIVVVTGDILHQGLLNHVGAAEKLLGAVSAGHGVYAVLGNHDWCLFSRRMRGNRHMADRISERLTSAGVAVLRNTAARVGTSQGDLQIVGIEEFWSQDYAPAAAFESVDPETPSIALSHNPDTFVDLSRTPAQWTLSGHTHGGQVRIPFLGAPILPVQHKEFVAGHFMRNGRHLYVNRGIGWIKRVRFGARPEVTVFTLTTG